MLALDEVVGLKVEIVTANDDVYVGRIHSHNPRGTIALVQSIPRTSDEKGESSRSVDFIAMNVDHVKSIKALERTKPRGKTSVNERFAKFNGAPTRISRDTLGEKIRQGSEAIKRQEHEFKLRKLTKDISHEGKIIMRRLVDEVQIPLAEIEVDEKNNIVFSKLSIKLFKPYKSTDVRIVEATTTEPVDATLQKETISAMEKSIDASWKHIEQTQKGG